MSVFTKVSRKFRGEIIVFLRKGDEKVEYAYDKLNIKILSYTVYNT
jgi:hypothetical protein